MINKEQQKLITKAEKSINTLLTTYANSADPKKVKKAKLLSYWLYDYARLLKKEDTFSPASVKKLKRGDIIQIHLGFNLGSEEGGLHYAVVVSNFIPATSDVITIIPLSSKKEGYKPVRYNIDLGNTLYDQLNTKYMEAYNTAETQLNQSKEILQNLYLQRNNLIETLLTDSVRENLTQTDTADLAQIMKTIDEKEKLKQSLEEDFNTIQKIQTEIARMKSGSIALVGQITTVSKLRIYNPLNKTDSLHGIKLSPAELNLIDEKLKELFTYTKV